MAIDKFVQPLLKLDIFQGLKPLQITEIARRAFRIIYKPGEYIIKENDESDAAVVIVNGEAIRISGPGLQGKSEQILIGSILAEMAMLIEMKYTSTIVAKSDVFALRISREEICNFIKVDKSLAEHFIGRLTHRLKAVSEELHAIENSLENNGLITFAQTSKTKLSTSSQIIH